MSDTRNSNRREHPNLQALDDLALTYPGFERDKREAERIHFGTSSGHLSFEAAMRRIKVKQRAHEEQKSMRSIHRSHPNLVALDRLTLSYPGWQKDVQTAEETHNANPHIDLTTTIRRLQIKQYRYEDDRSHPRLQAISKLQLTYPGWKADIRNLEKFHFEQAFFMSNDALFQNKLDGLQRRQAIYLRSLKIRGNRGEPLYSESLDFASKGGEEVRVPSKAAAAAAKAAYAMLISSKPQLENSKSTQDFTQFAEESKRRSREKSITTKCLLLEEERSEKEETRCDEGTPSDDRTPARVPYAVIVGDYKNHSKKSNEPVDEDIFSQKDRDAFMDAPKEENEPKDILKLISEVSIQDTCSRDLSKPDPPDSSCGGPDNHDEQTDEHINHTTSPWRRLEPSNRDDYQGIWHLKGEQVARKTASTMHHHFEANKESIGVEAGSNERICIIDVTDHEDHQYPRSWPNKLSSYIDVPDEASTERSDAEGYHRDLPRGLANSVPKLSKYYVKTRSSRSGKSKRRVNPKGAYSGPPSPHGTSHKRKPLTEPSITSVALPELSPSSSRAVWTDEMSEANASQNSSLAVLNEDSSVISATSSRAVWAESPCPYVPQSPSSTVAVQSSPMPTRLIKRMISRPPQIPHRPVHLPKSSRKKHHDSSDSDRSSRRHRVEHKKPSSSSSQVSTTSSKRSRKLGRCTICGDTDKNHVFVPCGHLCACKDCAGQVIQRKMACPVCRGQVTDAIQVFL